MSTGQAFLLRDAAPGYSPATVATSLDHPSIGFNLAIFVVRADVVTIDGDQDTGR